MLLACCLLYCHVNLYKQELKAVSWLLICFRICFVSLIFPPAECVLAVCLLCLALVYMNNYDRIYYIIH